MRRLQGAAVGWILAGDRSQGDAADLQDVGRGLPACLACSQGNLVRSQGVGRRVTPQGVWSVRFK